MRATWQGYFNEGRTTDRQRAKPLATNGQSRDRLRAGSHGRRHNSTRAFRLMRLDSLGTIGIECTSYAGSPTFMDGMLAVIPVG